MTKPWQGTVEAIRRTYTARGRSDSGLYSIEGTRLHERAIRAGRIPRQVLVSRTLADGSCERSQRLMHDLESHSCPVDIAPDDVLQKMVEGRGLGDIVGLVNLPDTLAVEDVLARESVYRPIVVAVDVFDPGNCGALVRTALAGGACLFVAAGDTDPYHPKAVQTSMGSLFKVPIAMIPDVNTALEAVRRSGTTLLGLACDADTTLQTMKVDAKRYAAVLGSEAFGLSAEVVDMMDKNVRIAMPTGVDSFSVNAAAAIALYELNRTVEP